MPDEANEQLPTSSDAAGSEAAGQTVAGSPALASGPRMNLMFLARKTALEMIGEPGSKREGIVQASLEFVARHCAEMAMNRCRLLNGDAMAMNCAGRPEMAAAAEMKADQFEWISRAILREFGLKEMPPAPDSNAPSVDDLAGDVQPLRPRE